MCEKMPSGLLIPVAIPENDNSVIHHLSWAKLPINRESKMRQQRWSGQLTHQAPGAQKVHPSFYGGHQIGRLMLPPRPLGLGPGQR